MKFKILNGTIYDPSQNINGKKQDLYIENGLIVKPDKSKTKDFTNIYDAKGMIVMAGAIDIHSHIAGGNVNNARLLSPEISAHGDVPKGLNTVNTQQPQHQHTTQRPSSSHDARVYERSSRVTEAHKSMGT